MFLNVHLSFKTAHCDALQHITPFRYGAGCALICLYPVTQHIATPYSTLHSHVECDSLYVPSFSFLCLHPATQHITTHYSTPLHSGVERYVPSCVFILYHSTLRRTAAHHAIQVWRVPPATQDTATQHTALHCNALQRTTLPRTATQHIATHCSTLHACVQ